MTLKNAFIIVFTLMLAHSSAQSLIAPNAANFKAPDIIFNNPAPISFIDNPFATIGIQLLHSGFSENSMRNNYLAYAHPITSTTALGLRLEYFSSDIFSSGNYSLFISQEIFEEILSIGLNTNWLHLGYDEENFYLFDQNDPIFKKGTTANSFSFGLGIFCQPVSGWYLGFSADHLNRPDLSIDHSGIKKDVVLNLGTAYHNALFTPQIDVRLTGEEFQVHTGLRKNVFNENLNIFAGYKHIGDGGSGIFAQLEFKFGDLGVLYNYNDIIGGEFAYAAKGNHQIGLFYTRTKRASLPRIILDDILYDPHNPQLNIIGKVINEDGLKYIVIRKNNQIVDKMEYKGNPKSETIEKIVFLDEGKNEIEIEAFGVNSSQKERMLVSFDPFPPDIQLESKTNLQTNKEDYQLAFSTTDIVGLEEILVLHNDSELKKYQDFSDPNNTRYSIPLKLQSGKNNFKIIARNQWRDAEKEGWIDYRAKELPPILKLDSPNRPVSATSSITVDIGLEYYQSVDEVILKINGEIMKRIPINELVDTTKTQEKGLYGIADRKPPNTLELKDTENLIEAVVLDKQGVPRASQSMKILYNPYAEQMIYDKKIAIIVGIDDYLEMRIPDLDLAVSDADTVTKILKNIYQFNEIHSMRNEEANFINLRKMISNVFAKAGLNDMVVLYFSGHGLGVKSRVGADVGYLMPYDAELNSVTNYISMTYLNEIASQSSAKDVLFLIDVCYSGLGIVEVPHPIDDYPTELINYESLFRKTSKVSRNIISAGGKDERAIDGLFARVLRQALLGAADKNHDHYINFTELAFYLKNNVSTEAKNSYNRDQNPQFGSLISDRGELFFKIEK